MLITILLIHYQKQPPELFYKKGVLKNFAKFTGQHLCQCYFFNKVAGLCGSFVDQYLVGFWVCAEISEMLIDCR